MSVRELIEERAKFYFKNVKSSKNPMLSLAGDIIVKVIIKEKDQCFSVVVNKNGYSFIDCNERNPTVTIEGKESTLMELINTLSSEKYLASEKKGEIKVIPHGIKGRLVVSRVKKLFGMN